MLNAGYSEKFSVRDCWENGIENAMRIGSWLCMGCGLQGDGTSRGILEVVMLEMGILFRL
jgi:hypothetical protein